MKILIQRSSVEDRVRGRKLLLDDSISHLYKKVGTAPRLRLENTNPKELWLYADDPPPTSGSGVITIWGMYYDIDNHWFYVTDPSIVQGIPLFPMTDILRSFGLSTPTEIDDMLIHYKFTGKLDVLLNRLVEDDEQSSFIRYLLEERRAGLTGDELGLELLGMIRSIFTFQNHLFTYTMQPENPPWENLRVTINTSYGLEAVAGEHLNPVAFSSADENMRNLLYITCVPRLGYHYGNLVKFGELKALNSADVLRMEGRRSDDFLYFTVMRFGWPGSAEYYEVTAEDSAYLQRVTGHERNAAAKMVGKHSLVTGLLVDDDVTNINTRSIRRVRIMMSLLGKVSRRILAVEVQK